MTTPTVAEIDAAIAMIDSEGDRTPLNRFVCIVIDWRPEGANWSVPGLTMEFDGRDALFYRDGMYFNFARVPDVTTDLRVHDLLRSVGVARWGYCDEGSVRTESRSRFLSEFSVPEVDEWQFAKTPQLARLRAFLSALRAEISGGASDV